MTTETKRVVAIKNGKAITDSRIVASYFKKAHFNVLQDIDQLIADAPSIALDFQAIELETKVGFGIRKDRAYQMSRDGFALLAMGFTGKKALHFKINFIEQFNAMEAQLKQPQAGAPIPATEVSTMIAKYMADMQETIVAPLVKIVADLIQNHQPVEQKTGAKAYIPSAEDLTPNLSARMVSQIEGVPAISNQEIGSLLTAYSYANGFQKAERKNGAFRTGYYCRAAVVGCFQLV